MRKYVDVFTFVPGAVAFHVASYEAMSLRRPKEAGWCRGLLLRGAAATLGPVDEPYLHAYPLARAFFGLTLEQAVDPDLIPPGFRSPPQ